MSKLVFPSPQPVPLVPAFGSNSSAERFVHLHEHWNLCCEQWGDSLDAWDAAAVKHRDRPRVERDLGAESLRGVLQLSWQYGVDRWLFECEPLLALTTPLDLTKWKDETHYLLKQIAKRPLCELQVMLMKSRLPSPLTLFRSSLPPSLLPHVHASESIEMLLKCYGFLAQECRLTEQQRRAIEATVIVWKAESPRGRAFTELVRTVVGKTYDAMRNLMVAEIPPQPDVPESPTDKQIDDIFNTITNWLMKATRGEAELPVKVTNFDELASKMGERAGRTASKEKKRSDHDERDAFIYKSMESGQSLSWIRAEIEKRSTWYSITTEQGVSQAAERYATRHGLQWPVQRD